MTTGDGTILPLEGVRVVDLSIMYAGPGTSMYLGDMGAEVIKVESHAGDDSRALGSTPFLGPNSRAFMVVNRNKRDIVLDLRQPAGAEIVHRLVKNTDVILHNFRPGVAERLGVDYSTLSKINPRLIYAWVTAFGSQGPYANKPAYDNVIQGYSGVFDARTQRDGEPTNTGTFVSDTTMPMLLGFAIGAALWVREQTGRGQMIEASLLGLALATQSLHWIRVPGEPEEEGNPQRVDPLEGACPVLACSDGGFFNMALVTDEAWRALCRALERADLLKDDRFATMEGRAKHRRDLAAVLSPLFQQRSRDEWLQLLKTGGVPCTPVVRRNDVFDQPYITENALLTTVHHPLAGPTRMMNVPVRLSETPGSVRRAAPTKGQDTDAILAEVGYSPSEIHALRESGVVG